MGERETGYVTCSRSVGPRLFPIRVQGLGLNYLFTKRGLALIPKQAAERLSSRLHHLSPIVSLAELPHFT